MDDEVKASLEALDSRHLDECVRRALALLQEIQRQLDLLRDVEPVNPPDEET